MPVGATIASAAATVGGAVISSSAAGSASKAQSSSDAAAIAEQQREFNINEGNQAPWLTTGSSALDQLASIYGLATAPLGGSTGTGTGASAGTGAGTYTYDPSGLTGYESGHSNIAKLVSAMQAGESADTINSIAASATTQNPAIQAAIQKAINSGKAVPTTATSGSTSGANGTAGSPDYSSFYESPDYQFAMQQGLAGVQASAAANGSLDSGATRKAEEAYAGNLASTNFDTYANRLAGLAGVGQTSANQLGATGSNTADQISTILQNEGLATGSSYVGQGAAYANGLQQLGGQVGGYFTNSANQEASAAQYASTLQPVQVTGEVTGF